MFKMSYSLIQKLLDINIIILSKGFIIMREVRFLIKQKEIEKLLEKMNKQGINLTQWFIQKVLEYDNSLD